MEKTKQRGSGWSIKLVFNLYKLFGYKFIYYLMYPVTFFYFIFATNVKESLKIYYKHLGIEFTNTIYYEHLRTFAITMVDRFITKVDFASYTFTQNDYNITSNLNKKATVLIFSHFGGWAASTNRTDYDNVVNIVMQESMKGSIKDIEGSIDTKAKAKIIDLNKGPIAVSIAIANALMNDEVVAIMGDRASNPNANIKVNFLGEDAYFNKNPFQIAYKMKKPIIVYFIVLVGFQKYHKELYRIDMDYEKGADEAVTEAIGIYIEKYENILRKYPNQWLNFYDFWGKNETI